MVEEGAPAPEFELASDEGETVTLSALRGKPVVLYFYPKADTPGCTTQACGVRDHRGDYEGADAVVLGVSPDPVKAVKKFHDKFDLDFTLLADADHAVCDAYGEFEGAGAVVLGVSPDNEGSHVKFKKKYDLPFTLLADTDHAVAEAYGTWVEKSMYGRKYMGIERSTFVIDPAGKVKVAFRKVKVDGHVEEVLSAVKK